MGVGWGGHQAPQEGEKKPTAWKFTGHGGDMCTDAHIPGFTNPTPRDLYKEIQSPTSKSVCVWGGATVLRAEW